MSTAPLQRPPKATPQLMMAGVIHAPCHEVFEAVREAVAPLEGQGHLAVDEHRGMIVVQGDWWYRAEYTIVPDIDGSRVELEILNVAQKAHFAGAWTGRSALKAAPGAFQQVLTAVAARVE